MYIVVHACVCLDHHYSVNAPSSVFSSFRIQSSPSVEFIYMQVDAVKIQDELMQVPQGSNTTHPLVYFLPFQACFQG